jgi:hypothetical protein
VANIVAVKGIGGAVSLVEHLLEVVGDGGFTGGGKAGEPDDGTLVAVQGFPLGSGDVAVKPCEVVVRLRCHKSQPGIVE